MKKSDLPICGLAPLLLALDEAIRNAPLAVQVTTLEDVRQLILSMNRPLASAHASRQSQAADRTWRCHARTI